MARQWGHPPEGVYELRGGGEKKLSRPPGGVVVKRCGFGKWKNGLQVCGAGLDVVDRRRRGVKNTRQVYGLGWILIVVGKGSQYN